MNLLKQPAIRQSLGLVTGLVIGIAGALLFQQSLPPEEESVEEKLEESKADLRKARQKIAKLEAGGAGTGSQRTVRDGMRSIAERLRNGEDVSLDDVFRTMKPWLRDMAPLFDRVREVQQEERFDSIAGEFSRKYGLSAELRDELKQWLIEKGEENAKEYRKVIYSDSSGFVDFVRVSDFDEQDVKGLDDFMEARLTGETLEQFKGERLEERIQSVEAEADRRLQRLSEVVGLEEDQVADMFLVLARGSEEYRPGMEFEGVDTETRPLGRGERDAAIRSVLRGEQLSRYDRFREQQREKAERDMRKIGLKLPEDWHLLDDELF